MRQFEQEGVASSRSSTQQEEKRMTEEINPFLVEVSEVTLAEKHGCNFDAFPKKNKNR